MNEDKPAVANTSPESNDRKHPAWVIGLIILLLLSLAANAWLILTRTSDKAATTEQTTKDTSETTTKDNTKYIELADQGVKIDPGEVEGLTAFAAAFEGGWYIYFSARPLEASAYKLLDGNLDNTYPCTAVAGPIGAISLYEPDTPYQEIGDETGKPAKDVLTKVEGTDYYVGDVASPQAFCAEDPEITNLQTSLIEKAKSIKALAL